MHYLKNIAIPLFLAVIAGFPCHSFVPSARVVTPNLGSKVEREIVFSNNSPKHSNLIRFASDVAEIPESGKKSFLEKVCL